MATCQRRLSSRRDALPMAMSIRNGRNACLKWMHLAAHMGDWLLTSIALERRGKTALASGRGNGALMPDGQERNSARAILLRAQAARLMAAASELIVLAEDLEIPGGLRTAAPSNAGDSARWTALARDHYRDRRLRGELFDDPAIFGEPAWDLLLDLYIAAREGKRVPVTSACIGAAVPTTTALRWLAQLEEKQLIHRENDASDARRVFVRLSDDALCRMDEFFARSALARRGEGGPRTNGNAAGEPAARPFMLGK